MTLREVVNGVEASIKQHLNDVPVYTNRRPKKFERESILLEGGPIIKKEIGGGQVQVDATVRLVGFTKVDDHGNSSTEDLHDTLESLEELFDGGYIRIGDRCPHVLETKGDIGFDFAEVTAKLQFFEAPARRSGSAAQDLMKHIHTTFDDKE